MTDPLLRQMIRTVTAVAVVALGALAAFVLPLGLVGALLVLSLLRICWLEDNIKTDLMGRAEMPANHLEALNQRRAATRLLTGSDGDAPTHHSPDLMATAMRGQIQALMAAGLAALAVLVARDLGGKPLIDLALGGFVLWLALRRADRLVVTLVHLDARRPLPHAAIMGRHPWVYSYRVDD